MMREKNNAWEWQQEMRHAENEDTHSQEVLFALMEEAIAQLPPQQQKAWVMCRRMGMKYEQAANEMHVSKDAIKKYLQYANTSIKKYISARMLACLL